jgi:hypothetical protein
MYACQRRLMGGDMEVVNKTDGQLEYFGNKTGFFCDEIVQLGSRTST